MRMILVTTPMLNVALELYFGMLSKDFIRYAYRKLMSGAICLHGYLLKHLVVSVRLSEAV